jgi:hypothetical protein
LLVFVRVSVLAIAVIHLAVDLGEGIRIAFATL